jgi:acyl-CoA synthetase (AMP-forming)/AMP-acid ligase II
MRENHNIARFLPLMARERPDDAAVIAQGARLSFAELNLLSDEYARGLAQHGIAQGERVLVLVRPGLDLLALAFALFKAGSVPVLIDPAMGRQNLATCIEEVAPSGFIGIPAAHAARLLFRKSFRSVRRSVVVGRAIPGAGPTLESLRRPTPEPVPIAHADADTTAAIAFTTGSTGVPKGVVYEHGMFNAQIDVLRALYGIEPGEIEMPAFPLFALFNVAMGVSSAIPPIDPTRPASCDPAEVVATIGEQRVTTTFGSPAIWARVAPYCLEHGIRLPGLRRILMAGAPVPLRLHEQFAQILEEPADTHTPYGATEALPITSISGREIRAAVAARSDVTAGTCVGRAAPGVTLRIIGISDEPIPAWDDALALPPNTIGEIVVKGPMVTKTYFNRPRSTELAKMREGDAVWHRMGDLGYFDDEGRVWFCGRKGHRVRTAAGELYTIPCEAVFNQHPHARRSALVGVPRSGAQRPVIIVEPLAGHMPKGEAARWRFAQELLLLGAQHPITAGISTVLFHPSFPVDIRHNAKIFREKLAVWAMKVLRTED